MLFQNTCDDSGAIFARTWLLFNTENNSTPSAVIQMAFPKPYHLLLHGPIHLTKNVSMKIYSIFPFQKSNHKYNNHCSSLNCHWLLLIQLKAIYRNLCDTCWEWYLRRLGSSRHEPLTTLKVHFQNNSPNFFPSIWPQQMTLFIDGLMGFQRFSLFNAHVPKLSLHWFRINHKHAHKVNAHA